MIVKLVVSVLPTILFLFAKRTFYNAMIVPILLCGAKTWMLKTPYVCRLTTLHNRCVCTILGVSRFGSGMSIIITYL